MSRHIRSRTTTTTTTTKSSSPTGTTLLRTTNNNNNNDNNYAHKRAPGTTSTKRKTPTTASSLSSSSYYYSYSSGRKIKLFAIAVFVLCAWQFLFASYLLRVDEDEDEWTAMDALTKSRSNGGGGGFGNNKNNNNNNDYYYYYDDNNMLKLEDATHDIDASPKYEPKMKLNAFGYVYWHRDRGEGVANWHASLAEVLRFARAHRRTLISPCVRNGQLKPCVYDTDDASSLRTSTCRTKRVGCKYPRKRSEKDLDVEEDLSSDVMRPMTLAQYYDHERLKTYVDDMVSYEQFAERFFERILEDARGKDGGKFTEDDEEEEGDGDGENNNRNAKKKKKKKKSSNKKNEKHKKKKYRAYRMDCSGDHCVLPDDKMCEPPTEEELYDEKGEIMKKWREDFDFDWLEYADNLEHPVTVSSSSSSSYGRGGGGSSPRKAMKKSELTQMTRDDDDDDEELYKNIIKKRKNKPDDEETKRRRKAPLAGRADLEEFARNGGVVRKRAKDDAEKREDEKEKKKVKNPLLSEGGDEEETATKTEDDQTTSSSMSSLGRLTLATDSETVGTDVIVCDDKNRFVTKIAMISYFHDKTVNSRPLTVTRRGLIRALNSTRVAPREGAKLEARRKENAKREMDFIRIEHPDAFELLDEDYIKGYENCQIDFCHAVVPDEPDEAISLSMKTLKNALKMRYLAKENENPLVNWKMNVNAVWYDFTSDEARLMYATEKWSRYIENIAIDFLGSRNLAHPYKAFHWKSKGYLDWRSADLEQDGVYELATRELEQKSMWCASEFVKSVRMEGVDAKARIALVSDIPANTDGGEDDSRHLVKPLTPSREPGDVDHRVMHMLWDLLNKTTSSDDAFSGQTTRGVVKIDVSNPYAIWANTTDSGIVGVIDHIIAEKAATLITCADPTAECAHCMNVDSEFVASVLTKRLLDRTPKARNTLVKWG